jgi:formimidoylglutamate deiminase
MARATKTGMSPSRATVRAFGSCASGAGTALVAISCPNGSLAPVPDRLSLPGFVNAHSHAFQRAMRGRAEGDDFWAWRDVMLGHARGLTPDMVRRDYETVYREMRAAGYTAVGEFNYVGFEEAKAAVEAARAAAVELVLLYSAYAHGGIDRFRQHSVSEYLEQVEELAAAGIRIGLAPHSVRACPPDWLEEIGRFAERESLILHVHADEQPREIEECLAEHGVRPVELLARAGCLGPRTTIVHATHADNHELDLLADAGARVCVCPTTEANLGDGFVPVERLRSRGIPLCIGSDSNVRIDPLEELRELEGTARRQALRRNVIPPEELLTIGSRDGAAALGLAEWPSIEVDLGHPALAGVNDGEVPAALVFGCGAEVFASP